MRGDVPRKGVVSMRRGVIGGAVLLVCLAAAGCGEDVTSPTSAAPFAGQFSGTWAEP